MTEPGANRRYRRAGIAGLVVGAVLVLVRLFVQPWLEPLALLAPSATQGSVFPARLFLLALAGFAVLEMPLLLVVMVRMAWRRFPLGQLNALHFYYTFVPSLYGLVGTLLTSVLWWLPLMWALGLVRIFSSVLAINPERLPKRRGQPREEEPEPDTTRSLASVRAFVIDMDGVLYRGNLVREGAQAFVAYLNEHRIPFVCLTNNATRTSAMYEEKLRTLGLPITADRVIGAAQAAAEWLSHSAVPGARVLPVGAEGLRRALANQGFALVDRAPADYVVVGLDPDLTYDRLKAATLAIQRGAQFIGTNPDTTFPAEEGMLPGNGATLAFLAAATGQRPHITGKPAIPMMQVALDHLGVPAAQVAMVGDRLETDIAGGNAVGMTTVLVMGGVTSRAELDRADLAPDVVVEDLGQLLNRWVAAYGQDGSVGQVGEAVR